MTEQMKEKNITIQQWDKNKNLAFTQNFTYNKLIMNIINW